MQYCFNNSVNQTLAILFIYNLFIKCLHYTQLYMELTNNGAENSNTFLTLLDLLLHRYL